MPARMRRRRFVCTRSSSRRAFDVPPWPSSRIPNTNGGARPRAARRRVRRRPNGWRLPVGEGTPGWQNEGKHFIAYIGTINEQDGVPHSIEALSSLPGIDGMRVVIAGDGSDRYAAERRATQLGIASSIEWLGWVTDRKTLGALVRAADVCVAPERDSSFNRLASFVKIVEYMSLGSPIVAHRLPQTVALCGDSIEYAQNMTPRALGKAIAQLLDEPARAARLGIAAQARFESAVAWENVGSRHLVSGYRSAFDHSAPRHGNGHP